MRKKIRAAHAAAWLLGGATLAAPGLGAAQTASACQHANPVYMSGSSAFKPVLQAVANVLGSAVNIVYQKPGSCEGLDPVLEGTKDTHAALLIVPNAATRYLLAADGRQLRSTSAFRTYIPPHARRRSTPACPRSET